ncbi:MAG: hypothetical protein ACNA78_00535 [Balneolaceae bacterium]
MFSVGEPERTLPTGLVNYSTFSVSWEFADFESRSDQLALFERPDFTDSVLRFRFDSPGLRISLGFGGSLTGMSNTSYFNANALLFNDLPILRRQRFMFAIPIQIVTDFKQAQNNNASREFQQSSFIFGSGAATHLKIGNRVDFTARATPNFGFSFSQGNVFGGSLFRFIGETRFHIANVFGSNALAIGYDFDYRDYDVDGDRDDARFFSHSITLGIGF